VIRQIECTILTDVVHDASERINVLAELASCPTCLTKGLSILLERFDNLLHKAGESVGLQSIDPGVGRHLVRVILDRVLVISSVQDFVNRQTASLCKVCDLALEGLDPASSCLRFGVQGLDDALAVLLKPQIVKFE